MVDFNFLPVKILDNILQLDLDKLYEIRLRKNQKVLVFYKNKYNYLQDLLKNSSDIICAKNDIDEVIGNITEHSLYAFNEQIKKGFLTTKDGVRVGLCGDVVVDDGKIKTINNFFSLNVRIPHGIIGASNKIFNKIIDGQTVKNTLIISAPFMGKTTILKDLCININNVLQKQILIIDERGEFENIEGSYMDKISYCSKEYALDNGIRSIAPEIIVTDELKNEDFLSLNNAKNSGVRIIATCHADSIEKLKNLSFFKKDIFNIYFVLKNGYCKGIIDSVYDNNFNLMI